MLGLDNIRKTRCVLIYPINKMYAIPEKKNQYQMIKLKYTVRNSKKNKTKQTKNKRIHVTMYMYTYEFRRGVVTDN